MTWSQIAVSNLMSAKLLWEEHPRSSASRSYYSAHVAVANRLTAEGYVPPIGRQTQPHGGQSKLVKRYLAGALGVRGARQLSAAVSRLYQRRIDADYKRTTTLSKHMALDSVRDAASVFRILGVDET